jgi:hypothetical protein
VASKRVCVRDWCRRPQPPLHGDASASACGSVGGFEDRGSRCRRRDRRRGRRGASVQPRPRGHPLVAAMGMAGGAVEGDRGMVERWGAEGRRRQGSRRGRGLGFGRGSSIPSRGGSRGRERTRRWRERRRDFARSDDKN